jgi:predicted dehydrogenase
MDRLGVGVIGCGYWGANLLRNFAGAPGWDLRWACDTDQDRVRASVGQYRVQATASVDDVLGDPAVAAVAVATPAHTHAGLTLAAIDAGKHVLVEKPLAPSLAEAEQIAAAARAGQSLVMCDHTYCYTPAVRQIRSLIEAGALGQIQYFDSVRINLGVVQPDVDVFWDLAFHDLSILDFILPADVVPLSVAAHSADPVGAGRACTGYLTLPLRGGGIAHTHVNWLSPTKIRRIIIGGSERMVVWDDLEPSERLRIYNKGVSLSPPLTPNERRGALISYRLGDMVAPALTESEALQGVVEELRSAILEQRSPSTGIEAGLRVTRVLDAASASRMDDGRLVALEGYR